MVINSILTPTSITSISYAIFECYSIAPFERNRDESRPEVISSRPISTSARRYIRLFIRKCKHLGVHTTRCVHKFCVSTYTVLYTCQCKSGRIQARSKLKRWRRRRLLATIRINGAICTSFKVTLRTEERGRRLKLSLPNSVLFLSSSFFFFS